MAAATKDVHQRPKSKTTPNYRRPTVNWCNISCNYDQKFNLPPRPSPPPLTSSGPRKSRMSAINEAEKQTKTTPLVMASPRRSTRPISDNPTISTPSTSSYGQRKPAVISHTAKTQKPLIKPAVIDQKPSSSKPKRSLYPPRVPTTSATTKRRPMELSKTDKNDLKKKKSKQVKQQGQEIKFALPPIGEGKHKRAETSPSFLLVTPQEEEEEGEERSICDINIEDELNELADDEIVAKVKQDDHRLHEGDEEEMKGNDAVERRNKKVKALVGAFETVISLQEAALPPPPPTVTTSSVCQPPHAQQQSQRLPKKKTASQRLMEEVK